MKRVILTMAVAFGMMVTASAQSRSESANDTTLVKSTNIEFFSQRTPDGKEQYYCKVDGVTYKSNKTSAKRFAVGRRFGGQPIVAYITNEKTKSRRISVL